MGDNCVEERYWQTLNVGVFLLIVCIVIIISLIISKVIKATRLSNITALCMILVLVIALLITSREVNDLAQDYDMVINGEYEEEDMLLVDYLNVHEDLDGNGQTSYTKPKFYIESKDEYIVLHLTDLEIGKTYRIRYYPNSKIAEVLYCVDEVTEETQ